MPQRRSSVVTASDRCKVIKDLRSYLPDMDPRRAVIILRDHFVRIAKNHNLGRDSLFNHDDLIDELRVSLGSRWGHIQRNQIRAMVIHCSKTPHKYGGGWYTTESNNHGARKGYKLRRDQPQIVREVPPDTSLVPSVIMVGPDFHYPR